MTWFTLSAPAGTPKPILDLLEKNAREIARSDAMKQRLEALGLDPVGSSAEEFQRNYDAGIPLIKKLVTVSGIRSE
jgi:tripartite-type tricarboxylate transporter receptor subunit TctC